jgi:methenyltetrahydromethanopterin cyclohydrolase
MNLNERASARVETLAARAESLRIGRMERDDGATVYDFGLKARGGYAAGRELARICLADLADVQVVPGCVGDTPCPHVQVVTDEPVAACLASQYAGWGLAGGKFFAMGSGPMRAAAGTEAIFDRIGLREKPARVVGVLEGRTPPPAAIVAQVAEACGVAPPAVTLLIAPTASLAGTLQVVARSVETALHKLAELGFDLARLVSAHGVAPLPPVAKDDLAAIGRTNDAILYGARVVLNVTGDDASLAEVGPKVPSSASKDHGAPFAEIFERYGRDFYKVDPHLFSPAQVVFQNLDTGRAHRFGRLDTPTLVRSFYE